MGCGLKEENEHLTSRVDSLQTELEGSQRTAEMLHEVGVMLDSIEKNQEIIRSSVLEGVPNADYKDRLESLNQYVKETEQRLDELQASLDKSQSSASSYRALANQLKEQLAENSKQLVALEEGINEMRMANEQLAMKVTEKDSVLMVKEEDIQLRNENIASLETDVQNLVASTTTEKAELFYSRGQALEVAADRTFFLAPQKKKETQMQALESYRRSFELGYEEAKTRIDELEDTLGVNEGDMSS